MKSNLNQTMSSVSLSSYAGGGSDALKRYIGTPYLCYQGTSEEWSKGAGVSGNVVFDVFAFEDMGIFILVTRMRDCFHYVLMDLSDPVLRPTLDIWKSKRGFVTVMETTAGVSAGFCRLSKRHIRNIQRFLKKTRRGHQPEAFYSFAQDIVGQQVMGTIARKQFELEGRETADGLVVEVQILADTKVRGTRDLGTRNKVETGTTDTSESPETGKQSNGTRLAAPSGAVEKARFFAEFSPAAASLKPEAPVLVSTLDLNRFIEVSRTSGMFRFGHFRVGERIVISFCLQSGAAQVFWLADSADPRVWALIDDMKKIGEAGFLLEGAEESVFIPWKLFPQEDLIGAVRVESLAHPHRRSNAAEYLAQSGFVEANATTDIPGIELAYVHVNVLSTEPTGMLYTPSSLRPMQHFHGVAGGNANSGHTLH